MSQSESLEVLSSEHEKSTAITDTPNRPSGKNFTPKQRQWIIAAIVASKEELKAEMNNVLERRVILLACNKLAKWSQFTTLDHMPSERSTRLMWKSFWTSDALFGLRNRGGGRKPLNIDADINNVLETNPDITVKALGEKIGVCRATVHRRLKTIKRERMKIERQRKKKEKELANQMKQDHM